MLTRRLASMAAGALLCAALLPAAAEESPVAPAQRRGVEQTFLTYPEWFLVHSPAEYAALTATRPATDFPFLSHTWQLWDSYASITGEQLRRHDPLNPGYHVMILVISTSTTVEYVIRSGYENTVGRVSFVLGGQRLTAEDAYAAKVAQDYVDFIRREPWYLFDFKSSLAGLWRDVSWQGPGMARKLERRFALTTEYLVKGGYAWLIEKATRAAYEPAEMITEVVLDKMPPPTLDASMVKVVRTLPDGRVVADLPRYYNFRIAATELAQQGVALTDIAGNSSEILVSAWVPKDRPLAGDAVRVLFTQPLATRPAEQRVVFTVPVPALSAFLRDAPARGVTVEHVYDY